MALCDSVHVKHLALCLFLFKTPALTVILTRTLVDMRAPVESIGWLVVSKLLSAILFLFFGELIANASVIAGIYYAV